MKNFEFHNPVKIIFGKDQLHKLSENIDKSKKVLLVYGGGSILKNGVYDQIMQALKGYTVFEFKGIEPNPRYETSMKAVELIKKEKIDFVLAAGGGSVVDAVKFIVAAVPFQEGDPWKILTHGAPVQTALPFGVVLTLPATGSEMNAGSVMTRDSSNEKLAFHSVKCYPQFSFLLPDAAGTLPKRQVANGVIDTFVHVLEQYITFPAGAPLQDRLAESVLMTLTEIGPVVYANPADYDAMSNLMWCATMALNGIIGCAVPQDWTTHMIGHELTAQFEIDHARTLAIIAPSNFTYNLENKKEKLAQFGERVFGIKTGTVEEKALAAIEQMKNFFHLLDVPTRLSEHTSNYEGAAQFVFDRFTERQWNGIGERGTLTPADVKKIVEMSY